MLPSSAACRTTACTLASLAALGDSVTPSSASARLVQASSTAQVTARRNAVARGAGLERSWSLTDMARLSRHAPSGRRRSGPALAFGFEIERDAVDAIAQARRRRTVGE